MLTTRINTRITTLLAALALAAASPVFGQAQPKKGAIAKQDQQYFSRLAQDNMAEVQAGKLAEKQASSNNVKTFARRMIGDHGRMLEEQRELAKSTGFQMPKQPGKEHQAAMEKLKKAKSGEQFDRAYMSQMVKDHEKTLQLVQQTARNAKNGELKAMAEKAEPVIEEHLKMAKEISDAASAGASK